MLPVERPPLGSCSRRGGGGEAEVTSDQLILTSPARFVRTLRAAGGIGRNCTAVFGAARVVFQITPPAFPEMPLIRWGGGGIARKAHATLCWEIELR